MPSMEGARKSLEKTKALGQSNLSYLAKDGPSDAVKNWNAGGSSAPAPGALSSGGGGGGFKIKSPSSVAKNGVNFFKDLQFSFPTSQYGDGYRQANINTMRGDIQKEFADLDTGIQKSFAARGLAAGGPSPALDSLRLQGDLARRNALGTLNANARYDMINKDMAHKVAEATARNSFNLAKASGQQNAAAQAWSQYIDSIIVPRQASAMDQQFDFNQSMNPLKLSYQRGLNTQNDLANTRYEQLTPIVVGQEQEHLLGQRNQNAMLQFLIDNRDKLAGDAMAAQVIPAVMEGVGMAASNPVVQDGAKQLWDDLLNAWRGGEKEATPAASSELGAKYRGPLKPNGLGRPIDRGPMGEFNSPILSDRTPFFEVPPAQKKNPDPVTDRISGQQLGITTPSPTYTGPTGSVRPLAPSTSDYLIDPNGYRSDIASPWQGMDFGQRLWEFPGWFWNELTGQNKTAFQGYKVPPPLAIEFGGSTGEMRF